MNPFKRDHLVGMVAAPIVWAVHFLLVYIQVSLVCGFGWNDIRLLGLDPAEIGIGVVTLTALALIGYTTAVNVGKYRRTATAPTSRFIALTALLLGLLSAIAVVWVALPAYLLPTCVQ